MNHSKYGLVALFILSAGFLSAAGDITLASIDQQASFLDVDFAAKYQIVQDKPGEGRQVQLAMVYRRDKDQTYSIILQEPAQDKGKGYLKIGKSLWLFDPVSKRFTVTDAKARFQNSNAKNSDFTRLTLAEDYQITASSKVKLGTFNCDLYDLEAKVQGLEVPRMKLWVSDDGLVRKYEDYSLSGQLLRVVQIPEYQSVGSRKVPVNILMIDMLRGKKIDGKMVQEKTVIRISEPAFAPLPNLYFTKAFLEQQAGS